MKSEILIFSGAGASTVFGFPTGKELFQLILSDLETHPDDGVAKYLIDEFEVSEDSIKELLRLIRTSRVASIDQFHSTRDDLMQLGKWIVTGHILKCEHADKLLPKRPDWLSSLLGRVLQECKTIDQARCKLSSLRFITLNYDRSIEQVIYEMLSSRYIMHDWDEARREQFLDFVNNRVHHLHGSLGRLQDHVNMLGRPYSPNMPPSVVFDTISKGILFLDPKNSSPADWEILNMELLGAGKVAFLGFGFHDQVTSRFKPNVLSGKPLFATLKGISGELRKSVLTLLVPDAAVWGIPKSYDTAIKNFRSTESENACEELIRLMFE